MHRWVIVAAAVSGSGLWPGLSGCTAPGQPRSPATIPAPNVIRPFPDVTVYPDRRRVEIEAWVCLDAGWLEQIACSPNSREHEALLVIKAPPRNVHAALLLAGFEPGAPGRWSFADEVLALTPPTGDSLRVEVRYARSGKTIEEPIGAWVVDGAGRRRFPDIAWVFAGSAFLENPESMGPGEHYVADITGSIIGLVTFGDEVIAFPEVLADQESVQALPWQVRSDYVPPIGTAVTVILGPVPAPPVPPG